MRKAFTLIELMMASAISLIVFSSIFVVFAGLWQLASRQVVEFQVALKARAVKERLRFGNSSTDYGWFPNTVASDKTISVPYNSQNGMNAVNLQITDGNGNELYTETFVVTVSDQDNIPKENQDFFYDAKKQTSN